MFWLRGYYSSPHIWTWMPSHIHNQAVCEKQRTKSLLYRNSQDMLVPFCKNLAGNLCNRLVLVKYHLQCQNWLHNPWKNFKLLQYSTITRSLSRNILHTWKHCAGWHFLMLNRPLVSLTTSAVSDNRWLDTKGRPQLCILGWHVAPFIYAKTVHLKPSQQEETLKVRPLSQSSRRSVQIPVRHRALLSLEMFNDYSCQVKVSDSSMYILCLWELSWCSGWH